VAVFRRRPDPLKEEVQRPTNYRPVATVLAEILKMKHFVVFSLLLGALLFGPGQAWAQNNGRGGGQDKKAPTAPTNLRVTGVTAGSVSLAWNPSTDNSGKLKYRVLCSNNTTMTVPQFQTTAVFSSLRHNTSYTFRVYAFDASNNISATSNAVTVSTLADTTPPSQPVVALTHLGPTHISLAWSSTDDTSLLTYEVSINGQATFNNGSTTMPSGTLYFLQPETTYTITVRARDNAMNWSAPSDPLVITTPPTDPSDGLAPTAPSNITAYESCGEYILFWQQSTDNVTPDAYVSYEVFLNGTLDHRTMNEDSSVFAVPGILNQVDIYAIDERGNRSVAGTLFIDLR
jgi:chitodextrinase